MGPQLVSCGCDHLMVCNARDTGFNGAAARELRMQNRLGSGATPSRASMGPQLVSCGCANAVGLLISNMALQWGRSS